MAWTACCVPAAAPPCCARACFRELFDGFAVLHDVEFPRLLVHCRRCRHGRAQELFDLFVLDRTVFVFADTHAFKNGIHDENPPIKNIDKCIKRIQSCTTQPENLAWSIDESAFSSIHAFAVLRRRLEIQSRFPLSSLWIHRRDVAFIALAILECVCHNIVMVKSKNFGGFPFALMTDSGKIVLDIDEEAKKGLTVKDLLDMFREGAGKNLDNDRILLSQ